MQNLKKTSLVAMSGGVDSSVAAYLTKQKGFECAGATMRLFDSLGNFDAKDAKSVAYGLGMPHYVFDFADEFKRLVIESFVAAYQNGETPNPCVECNRHMKFEKLLNCANQLGLEYIATGHYAKIEQERAGGRYLLKKGADEAKDQSYVLYFLKQKQLERIIFPLGGLCKAEVRDIAEKQGFSNAKKPESQDICFVKNESYADFIARHTGKEFPKGRFVDTSGRDMGENKGVIHYTVGQRRGLGIAAPEPLYVCSVCAKTNTVTVGAEENLYKKTLVAKNINLIALDRLDAPLKVRAKIRYRQPEQEATVWQSGPDMIQVEFERPQRAITKGQAVVLYDGDIVIGGGTICGI